ncbi:hypothetical protein ABEB36_006283 [Hypothenemus hampei]|uniref:Virilizer N-terminal domain-containing protein n=1 Tax=Hypothenemus hampei TaxID=57062 RepID=A0ABD1EQ03_HYPHA
MMSENLVELLFFDTFAHDSTEEVNLDLVQFPKPVYVSEVRIIPLGARVQADFPGGVRLGATNPSQFEIEFFVNDLGKPGASTFESLGAFKYDQNGKINLEHVLDDSVRKIPTDGLVLKGFYTTITLAVYGTLTKNLSEQLVQPIINPALPGQSNTLVDAPHVSSADQEWPQDNASQQPMTSNFQDSANYQPYTNPNEVYAQSQEYPEYYSDVPKDPRSYHHTPESEWDKPPRNRDSERERARDVYQERDHLERSSRRYSRSQSKDRDRSVKEYRESSRERDNDWEKDRDRDRNRSYDRDRRHDESSKRYWDERDDKRRPRTPPLKVTKHSPIPPEIGKESSRSSDKELQMTVEVSQDVSEKSIQDSKDEDPENHKKLKPNKTPSFEENTPMDVEVFEPILSDEDIVDDNEQFQDTDYDYTAFTNNDELLRQFIPGVTDLQKYALKRPDTIEENLKIVIGIADDYLKSSITKYELTTFSRLNTEIKEEFVHLCEKFLGVIDEPELFVDIMNHFNGTKCPNDSFHTTEDMELKNQVVFIIETITDWLKIALNYDLANLQDQPAYKIRHIKSGVRLAELLCHSEEYIQYVWQKNYNIHNELLDLYQRNFMALSIKLMILRALDTYLWHKFSIEKFLVGSSTSDTRLENGHFDIGTGNSAKSNGYRIIVKAIQKNPLVREKFALTSILKKLNLFEVLSKIHGILIKLRNISHDISAEEINLTTKALNQILNYCKNGNFTMSQPKRLLPLVAQFEIGQNETNDFLIRSFKMFNLLESFALLLTCPSTLNLPAIKTPIFEIISILLKNPEGLVYLSENCDAINILLKCLLRTEEEELQYNDCIEVDSHNLGLQIAYKIQSLYYVECLFDLGEKHNYDCDSDEIIDSLHSLFCLSFSNVGKFCVGDVLSINSNINSLLQFFPDSLKPKYETNLQKLKQSPATGYIIDLLYIPIVITGNVQFLEAFSSKIRNVLNAILDSTFTHPTKIAEIKCYLSPLDNVTCISYCNTTPYLNFIENHTETVISNPGPVITSLRILQHLGIPQSSTVNDETNVTLNDYIELKYKHVVLQLYSLDGSTMLVKLLQKLCKHFEQPGVHTSIFASNQGQVIVNIIHPTVLLLKKMLGYVISCRNTEFNDLTTVPIFLSTYNLLNSFPVNAAANGLAQKCKITIIDTLLVYTQPVSQQVKEKDSLNRTLWSQMIGEVIKYVTTAPFTFVSGLLVLSELLPLPLPVHTRDELSKSETSWIVNLRKLWSAHLHPHTVLIQDTINKICVSTQPQLLNLLRRICVQIADLAANSALMIARGFLDSVYTALAGNCDRPCTNHVVRLLNFLACLMTHAPIKGAVLHLIHSNACIGTSKTDEKYSNLITCFGQILSLNDSTNSHVQSQECILSIIQSFCDVDLTLMQNCMEVDIKITSEVYLANALPSKEYLTTFITMILDHLGGENSFLTYLPIVRTLLLLTEHDYGFFHLRDALLKRQNPLSTLLTHLEKKFSKTSSECLNTLNAVIEFLRICLTIEENDGGLLYNPRTISLSLEEVRSLIDWKSESEHPLTTLEATLKNETEEDNNLESICESLNSFLKQLLQSSSDEVGKGEIQETVLSSPESLLTQFSSRVVFSSLDACNERLTAQYWLALPTEDHEGEIETMPCDLFEICRQLPIEFNLIKEVEKLCRISRTEAPAAHKTLNHNEEQKTKSRKPFITPMRPRGFPRSAPQRPDLFRSRPPNTSRPPSLHVDDFVALETCGAQPTGPTGYNKLSREILASSRMARGVKGKGFVTSERNLQYSRQMPWWGAPMGRNPYF